MRDALAGIKTANGSPVLETDGEARRAVAHDLAVLGEAARSPKPRLAHPGQGESSADRETKTERSPNVRWQGSRLTRAHRWRSLGQAGATVWFTGLPGAGKSTVATAVEERLVAAGRPAFLLDGDNLRHGLNGDLGFDELARCENVRRTAHVARLLAESGMIALVSLISPYIADRQTAAALHAAEDLRFLEVFVSTPLEECEERDPKGLYARARAGELKNLTGVGAPYEPPTHPDLVLHTCSESVHDEVERVLELLAAPRPR
ncbi:MAG TPA: adenylyl-sulfate kinase [Solirubrobacteraceae bacterium]|jgi:adenylyl-sulfate kinase|nr:adenylyl-sulfate kinase [Solirubrobacteraceae bacterium]